MPVKLHLKPAVLVLIAFISYGAIRHMDHNSTAAQTEVVKLPEIYFYDKLDHKVTTNSFLGKTVLVNLWATWCAPCVAELPSLARLQARLPADKFTVVAISMDKSSLKDIHAFLNAKGAKNLEVYWDKDRQVPLKWKYEGIPTSFLLDHNGFMVRQYNGSYEWDTEPILGEVVALLK